MTTIADRVRPFLSPLLAQALDTRTAEGLRKYGKLGRAAMGQHPPEVQPIRRLHVESMNLYRCQVCGVEKPHTIEFYSPCKSFANGLYRVCKACRAARAAAYREVNPRPGALRAMRRKELLGQGYQECRVCKEIKPSTTEFFYASKVNSVPLERQCKLCRDEQTRARKAADPERFADVASRASSKYYSKLTTIQKKVMFEKRRVWSRENQGRDSHAAKLRRLSRPEHFRAESRTYYQLNRSRIILSKKCWAQQNPDKVRVTQAAARARRRQAPGTYTYGDIQKQLEAQKFCCYWCRTKLILTGKDRYQMDHLIALSRGGTNHPNNLVCACKSCNNVKHARMPWDFNGRLL